MRSRLSFPALAFAAALLLSLLGAVPGGAQPAPPTPPPISVKGGNASLTTSAASANVALPSSNLTFSVVQLINDGANELFYNLGTTSGVTAASTNAPLPAGASVALFVGQNTFVAAISPGGASTLRVIQWNGAPTYARAGSSGGGGGAVSSVSNTDGTITASPTTGAVVVSVANMVYPANDSTPQASMGWGVSALSGQTAAAANYQNTAVGYQTMVGTLTTGGTGNVAVGYKALNANTSGAGNVAIGNNALLINTTGGGNMAIGGTALASNIAGNNNVAVGVTALNLNTASSNTAIGRSALSVVTSGNSNVAIGTQAGQFNTGSNSVFVGSSSGLGVNGTSTGGSNTMIGQQAGLAITSGASNTCIGNTACNTLTSGAGNILIGAGRQVPTAGTSSYLDIGGTIQANDLATLELDFNVTLASTTTFAKRVNSISHMYKTVVTGNAGAATITGVAPGAGQSGIIAACGTNAGTGALYAGAGTSTTYVKLLDNLGTGVTGC